MPTAYLISHNLQNSRDRFCLPTKYTTTKAEGRPTVYATIPVSNSYMVLIFVKKPIRSSVCPYRPDRSLRFSYEGE